MGSHEFLVDTREMAVSVNGVSSRLDNTTQAVIAMQAAVIQTEREAADTICKNVDRGFLTLMQSQVSTKKAQFFSEMTAKMANLMELSKSLAAKGNRMEEDVERLHRQYYVTFRSLDHALENRILQLDKEAMQLGKNRKELIMTRQLKDLSVVTTTNRELHNTAQLAMTARIKSKTSKAISSMGNNASENDLYRDQVESVLEDQTLDHAYTECVPVLYVKESSMVMRDASVPRVVFPDNMGKATSDPIENYIMQNFDQISSTGKSRYEEAEITHAFEQMTAQANINPRVSRLMMQLFKNGGCS